jgi:phosphatidylcholine synthase
MQTATAFGLIWAGLIIVLGSALYFADTRMKTVDLWFRGFPAIWNVVIFYIVIFTPPAWLIMLCVLTLTAMQFLPVVFVHPVRVKRWRPLTLAVLLLWCLAALFTLVQALKPDLWVKAVLVAGGLYFFGLGLLRQQARKAQP